MSFSRKLARSLGVEKIAARMLGKTPPHDGARMDGVIYNDDPQIDRLVFICGLHRSGTTLLERLLAASYDVSVLRANVPESEGQHMQDVYSPAHNFGGPGRFAFSEELRSELAALSDYEEHRRRIMERWSHFVVGQSPVLLEKSPPNLTKIGWLRRVFPASRFIVMTRDPRAVAAATQKWSKGPLMPLMEHWDEAHRQAIEELRDDDCSIIRYEDLTENTEAELARIAAETGLEPKLQSGDVEQRHRVLTNSNQKYIDRHPTGIYGSGAWDYFGYKLD